MKTLHFTNSWHATSGGIATFYREMLRTAERLHRPMRVVVPAAADGVEEVGEYGRIYYVKGRASRLSPGYRVILPPAYLLPHGRLREILDAERPDLVECCDKYTLNFLAGLLRRGWLIRGGYRPTVVGLSCERMDENMAHYFSKRPLAQRFCRWYMRWLYFPLCDHHIAVSPHTAGELQDVSGGHDVRRGVWVRPMGASCDLFSPERRSPSTRSWLRSLAGGHEDATLLLYVGRLAPEKNLSLLVKMMCRLEDSRSGHFHLVVTGDGHLRRDLEEECARRIPGAVGFLGHVRDRETLASIYANCDIFVHPNPREPFGIALLEAMASGLPLVAPPSGGVICYANRGNACLADPTPDSFADAVSALRDDPVRAGALRIAARATAQRFDWPDVTASFFELYEELNALAHGVREEPAIAPAFYSTQEDHFGWESGT